MLKREGGGRDLSQRKQGAYSVEMRIALGVGKMCMHVSFQSGICTWGKEGVCVKVCTAAVKEGEQGFILRRRECSYIKMGLGNTAECLPVCQHFQ